jgi:hypothetical protein
MLLVSNGLGVIMCSDNPIKGFSTTMFIVSSFMCYLLCGDMKYIKRRKKYHKRKLIITEDFHLISICMSLTVCGVIGLFLIYILEYIR